MYSFTIFLLGSHKNFLYSKFQSLGNRATSLEKTVAICSKYKIAYFPLASLQGPEWRGRLLPCGRWARSLDHWQTTLEGCVCGGEGAVLPCFKKYIYLFFTSIWKLIKDFCLTRSLFSSALCWCAFLCWLPPLADLMVWWCWGAEKGCRARGSAFSPRPWEGTLQSQQ